MKIETIIEGLKLAVLICGLIISWQTLCYFAPILPHLGR